MLNFTKKKKNNKINTYRTVRENILLNNNNHSTEPTHNINYESLVFQMNEINLTHHITNQIKGKSNKIIVKWWEN